MNKLLLTLVLTFFVQVKVPGGISRTYDNVKAVAVINNGSMVQLTLANDKTVLVPAMFTVVEEK